MLNRRHSLAGIAVFAGLAASVQAKDRCVAFTPAMQQAKSPDEALQRLKDGNARFAAGEAL
ncbi:MAG TPA: hypothetical protein PLB41_10290, partial [Rubrivivax sp.]|nr:hypothetical protein [Rubrivivax sp.]